jgi:hypothetical protein
VGKEAPPPDQFPVSTAPNRLPAKVPPKELRAWAADFGKRNPDATFKIFLQNARLVFAQFRVTERPMQQVIAELGMTKGRGNPAITRK